MELCRLCYSEVSLHLIRTVFNAENEPPFLDIIEKLTDIEITQSDPYPKIMCTNCYDKLANFYDFLKIIKETDTKFRQHFNTNNEANDENVQVRIKQEMDYETEADPEIDTTVLNGTNLSDNKTKIDIDDCFATVIKEEIDANQAVTNDKEDSKANEVENATSSNDETNRESALEENSTTENINCKICGERFKHKKNLTKHLRTHDKVYRCYICREIFPDLADLEDHRKLHSTNKPYECHICKKTFTMQRYLVNHLKRHVDEAPIKCDICDKEFSRKDTLRKHKKVHAEDRNYQCDVCDHVFTHFADLRCHKLEHRDKVYECKICGKKYAQQAQSLKHVKVHFGEKKHQCNICGEKFTLMSLLTKHLHSHKDKVLKTIVN